MIDYLKKQKTLTLVVSVLAVYSLISLEYQVGLSTKAKEIERETSELIEKDKFSEERLEAYEEEEVRWSNVCEDKEFWKETRVTFDKERGQVYFQFPSTPSEVGVTSLQFTITPKEIDLSSRQSMDSGFHLHNVQRLHLSTDRKVQAIPMALSVTEQWGNNNKVKNKIAGYSKLVDTELIVYSGYPRKTSIISKCIIYSSSVDLFEFDGISRIAPYFEENIIEPYALLEVNINNFDQELNYINSINELNQLHKQNTLLPKPNEEALALLRREYNYDKDFIGPHTYRWEWTRKSEWRTRYSTSKDAGVVFGLFGEVESSDLETLSTIIRVLHVVAPGLNASYSTDPNKVTLPIHYTTCTQEALKTGLECHDYAGFFIEGNYGVHNPSYGGKWDVGWIWIDANMGTNRRDIVLYHEVGHSLGLPHNSCFSSRMSYERWSGAGWMQLDLMMLNVMYNPNKEPIGTYFHPVANEHIDATHLYEWHEQKIIYYNLDEEKVDRISEEPWEACGKKERGWEDLISLIIEGKENND